MSLDEVIPAAEAGTGHLGLATGGRSVPFVQFEVTTRCNFDCFYCAGRAMRQGDMSLELFRTLLDAHVARHGVPETVSLQGEGEPTLNKAFFEMAAYTASLGAHPYTITNGTYKHPERFLEHFQEVGVSIDTLDPKEAERVGRHNLPRVLQFTEWLAGRIKVTVFTVALSKSAHDVHRWCTERGIRHVAQPLQTKSDYQIHYHIAVPADSQKPFRCRYVDSDRMRYFNLDGVEMPCCFIKDTSQYPGLDALKAAHGKSPVPGCCSGCRELR